MKKLSDVQRGMLQVMCERGYYYAWPVEMRTMRILVAHGFAWWSGSKAGGLYRLYKPTKAGRAANAAKD